MLVPSIYLGDESSYINLERKYLCTVHVAARDAQYRTIGYEHMQRHKRNSGTCHSTKSLAPAPSKANAFGMLESIIKWARMN